MATAMAVSSCPFTNQPLNLNITKNKILKTSFLRGSSSLPQHKTSVSMGKRYPAKSPSITAISDIPEKIKSTVASVTNGHLPLAGEDEARRGTHGKPLLTTGAGQPVDDDNNSLTVGESGTISIEDFHFFDKMSHFNRERVPERVVHAKGAGAHGYFEVTQDISDICKAKVFSEVGKKTPLFARFSHVTGEKGFTDLVHDVRGFSLKFYTEEGNWDMVGNNTPVFFVRDPIKFPDLIHALKRNPQTNLRDANSFWDFLSLVPESIHQVLITFSPRGVPDGYRFMTGYGSHTFKMVNEKGEANWVKFHFEADGGTKNLTHEEALAINSYDPDYATRDLKEAIDRKDFPSWTFSIQVMPLEDAEKYKWDPFDITKVWLKKDYPLREVGRVVLDRNPNNYFAEVEQVAFSPAHMPPGIEPSPDRVLQSRLFSYDDTARHRIGTNFMQLPINRCPFANTQTYQRDGAMVYSDNGGSGPNYFPNSFESLPQPDPSQPIITPYSHSGGTVGRYLPQKWKDQDDYEQPRMLWREKMTEEVKEQTVTNIANHLGQALPNIQARQIDIFRKVDLELAARVTAKIVEKQFSPEPKSLIA